jgi:hypothetical protein
MGEPANQIRRALHLVTNVEGKAMFVVGEDDCQAISALPGGAGYEVTLGAKLLRIPEHRVAHFEQVPRPGYEQGQRDAKRELPSFAIDNGDGSFTCKECGASARSVHALKTHYGRAHGDQR